MKIVFMGTPEFAVPSLLALLDGPYSVVAVYTQPDKPTGRGRKVSFPPVKEAAIAHGLTVIQPETFKSAVEVRRLEELRPDAIVVVAYGKILPDWLLKLPRYGCINVHFSLLPRHRGAAPVASAILAGDEVTGVTIALVEPKLDTGPILSQRELKIEPQDTAGSLTGKLARIGAELLTETLPAWFEGKIQPKRQNEAEANYFSKIGKEESRLDWRRPAAELWRRVRAFQPAPGAHTYWSGKRLKINEAVPLDHAVGGVPGEVVALSGGGPAPVGVVTGKGILGLCQLQLEGKRPVQASAFVQGHRDFIGSRLE